MNANTEVLSKLRKAMEFYSELGFEYLPLKRDDLLSVTSRETSDRRQDSTGLTTLVAESTGEYIIGGEDALRKLRDELGDCRRCRLSMDRKNIVFGEGDPEAKLMFIGEGPGRDEDIQARPFVGDAGKLLTNLIVKLGLKREDVYIANIVKCRPPNNRNPEEDEILTCKPFLEKQIRTIHPKIIVCLGKVAANALLGNKIPITKLRGNFFHYNNIPVMPTFHPAYLLRNPKDKWLTWEDMQKVLEKLRQY